MWWSPHFLTVLTFLPLVGALLLLFVGREQLKAIRNLAFVFSLATFAVSPAAGTSGASSLQSAGSGSARATSSA